MSNNIGFMSAAYTVDDSTHPDVPDGGILISGRLVEVGIKNLAKWGITPDAVDGIIKNFPDIPIRNCNNINAHACDDMWDASEHIGYGVKAWRGTDGWIWASAAITDPSAAERIQDGTWTPHGAGQWSVVGIPTERGNFDKTGLLNGVIPTGVSMVFSPSVPAFVGSGYEMVAAAIMENGDMENKDEYVISAAKWTTASINGLPDSSFAYIESCYGKTSDDKNMRHLPYKDASGKIDLAHLRAALSRVNQIKMTCPADKGRTEAIISATRSKLQAMMAKAKGTVGAAIIMEDNMEDNKKDGKDLVMYTQEQLNAKIKEALDAKIAELKVTEAKQTTEVLAKQKLEFDKQMEAMTAEEKKAFEAKFAEMTPTENVEKMVAAAVIQAKEDTLDTIKRDNLISEYGAIIRKSPVVGAPFMKDKKFDQEIFDTEIAGFKDLPTSALIGIVNKAKMVAAAVTEATGKTDFDEMSVDGQPPGMSVDDSLNIARELEESTGRR